MMITSRHKIIEIISGDRVGVLHSSEAVEINIYLNTYYFQLRGALDNAAWALSYQFGFINNADEDNPKGRKECDLFSKHFLARINENYPKLAESLKSKTDWAKALKRLRDSATHRIPLYAIPGVRSPEEEAAASAELQKSIEVTLERKADDIGFEKALFHITQSDQIGHYEPLFATYGPNGHEIKRILPQVNIDHGTFLEVMGMVMNTLMNCVNKDGVSH